MKLFSRDKGDREVQADQHKAILESTKPLERSPVAAAPAGEGEAQLLQEREWDTHASMQGRRDLPQEVIDKHPSLSDPQQASPATSAALPPLPPISADMDTSGDRALATGSTLEHTHQPATLPDSRQLGVPTTTGSLSAGPHRGDIASARTTTESSSSSKSSGAHTSSVTTGRAGPPSLSRVSISTITHEALDRTAPGDYHLVTHLGKQCATCSTGKPAGHVLTHEQQQLLARASDLELEQRQHADAAAEAARIAAAAAGRATELETEIRVDVTERRTLLLQQEETARLELSRLAARRQELMGRVGDLQAQLTALVEEEEGLLREQLEAETARGDLEKRRSSMTATVRDIETRRERLQGELGQAESLLADQVRFVEEAEAAVQEALRRLQEAQARKAEAEGAVVSARGAVEAVLVQVGHVSQDREVHLTELQGIETELPTALQRLEALRAEQHTLRARAEALQSEAARVKREEEEAVERQERLQQESHSLSHLLTEVTARAHTLSCQAAAAAAKAAGARGLQAGEDARACAAAAEAEGLRAAAAALAEAAAATTAALATTTTFISSHISPADTTTTSSSIGANSARDTAALGDISAGTGMAGMTGMSSSTPADVSGGMVRSTPASEGLRGMEAEHGTARGPSGVVEAVRSALQPSTASEGATKSIHGSSADVSGGAFRFTPAAAEGLSSREATTEGLSGTPLAHQPHDVMGAAAGGMPGVTGAEADIPGRTFRDTTVAAGPIEVTRGSCADSAVGSTMGGTVGSTSGGVMGVGEAGVTPAREVTGRSADIAGRSMSSTPAAAAVAGFEGGDSTAARTAGTGGVMGAVASVISKPVEMIQSATKTITGSTEQEGAADYTSEAAWIRPGVTGAAADIPGHTLRDTTVAAGPIEVTRGSSADSSTVGSTSGGVMGVGEAGVAPAREVTGRSADIPGRSMSSTPAAAVVAGIEGGDGRAARSAGAGGVMGAVASVTSKPIEMIQSATKTRGMPGVTGEEADIPGRTFRDTTVAAGPIEATETVMGSASAGSTMGSTSGGVMGVGEAGVAPAREVTGRSADIAGRSMSSTPAAANVAGIEGGHSTAARSAGIGGVMGAVASVISKPVEMIQEATQGLTGSTAEAASSSTSSASTSSSSSSGVGVGGVREGYQGLPSPGGTTGTAAGTYPVSSSTPATRILSQSEVTPLMSSSDMSAPVDDATLGSTAVGSTAAGSTLGEADVMMGAGMRSVGESEGVVSGSGPVGGTRSVTSELPRRASGGGLLGAIRGMLAAGQGTYQEAAQEGEATATLPVGDLPIMTPATVTTRDATVSTFAESAETSFAPADTTSYSPLPTSATTTVTTPESITASDVHGASPLLAGSRAGAGAGDRVPSRSIDISSSSSSSSSSGAGSFPAASDRLPAAPTSFPDSTVGGGLGGSVMPPHPAHDHVGVHEQHSNMQQLLQEGAEASQHVPDAAAMRTTSSEAPLEPLGSPVLNAGNQPASSGRNIASAGISSEGMTGFEPSIIAAEAADDAVNHHQQQQQQGKQKMVLNRSSDDDNDAFDSPSNSAYHTPASAMSLASMGSRDPSNAAFYTPASAMSLASQSMDTEAIAPVAPNPSALTPVAPNPSALTSQAAAAPAASAKREMSKDSADTQAAVAAAKGVSGAGQGVSEGAVYVCEPHLAAGLDAVPQGSSYEEAAEEANALTAAVVSKRESEMTSQGEQKSENSERSEKFTVQLELPAKAFDSLSRPAGLVQGAPVSPHAHAAQQPGIAGAADLWAGSSTAVLQGGGGNTVLTSLSTASHTNTPDTSRSTGLATGAPDVSDAEPLRDGSSSTRAGMMSAVKAGLSKPIEMVQDALDSRSAAKQSPEPEADKPLGRRSYAEALAANLPAADATGVTPTPSTTTPTATEPAVLDTPTSKHGLVEGRGPAAAPAGPAVPTTAAAAAAAEQSPRKRSFFGNLKKALGSSSSRNEV